MPLDPKDLTHFPPRRSTCSGSTRRIAGSGRASRTNTRTRPGSRVPGFSNGTDLLPGIQRRRARSGSRMRRACTLRGVRWGRLPTPPTTRVLRKLNGMVTGPGHGCVIQGPDGVWWQFYTIVLRVRRAAAGSAWTPTASMPRENNVCDPPARRRSGRPARCPIRAQRRSGSIPLTINKLRNIGPAGAHLEPASGHDAADAVDDSNGTRWEPAEDAPKPSSPSIWAPPPSGRASNSSRWI